MDASNTGGVPVQRNGQMRPPPSPGNSSINLNMRPPHPNQRPPQQSQHMQPPPMQGVPGHQGRSPVMSPFQKQDHSAQGQQPAPTNPNFQPPQQRPPTASPAPALGQRPPPQQQQQQQQQQHPAQVPYQQQPRPHAPPVGQQPAQFPHPGRPAPAPINSGSQGQLRPNAGSPQTQPSQMMRPSAQGNQQLPPQPHQPPPNGFNLRPSVSHANLTGDGTGMQQGNRFTPPSPHLLSTRSPQIRPLQHSPQAFGSQGNISTQHQQQQQQQQQQHQQPTLRPSASQPNLGQQPGVRPPSNHGSPSQPHPSVAVRPQGHPMQQLPRPRPPQVVPQGQTPSPQPTQGQTVQFDMPAFSVDLSGDVSDSVPPRQNLPHPQQRPPGARPIFDQMRQQVANHQPLQTQGPALGQVQAHSPQNQNPMQRQPQRPPPPHQGQPPRQQQQMNSPQRAPVEAGPRKDQSSSPQHQNPAKEHPRTADQSVLNGDHGKPPQHSPQQHHAFPPSQRPPNPQQPVGSGMGQHQHHGLAGHPVQSLPPRPHAIPGSPAQRPLGATELQAPGSTSGMQPRPSPAAQHQLPAHHQPLQAVQPGESEFKEPDEPLSDMDDNGFDEDDIEGGATTVSLSKEPASQVAGDRPPPPQTSAVAAQSTGPPAGPPTGPPRGPPRKLSSSAGSGPARVAQPAHDPTSPPASAFPPAGPPRLRARPPPGNKEYTPYRPPERPSQAPVMYSQSGQPTLSQPLLRQDDTSKGQSSPATSMVPQGADAASSSVRPRDGSLQKRTFAGENNAPKADSSAKVAPPSPRLHGQKGPAILSVSGQKSPSSALKTIKTIKTWTIRGGLLYLGYTAVFSCRQEPTGVKGLYCKATNGIGGLVKPFVAPHYNAHLGPHVDRYIKPVVRQSHRVYLKVADPVVQGAMSAVGVVYESTAKKHVDSAKDQVISVLPYPFKRKSSGATDIDQGPDTHEETRSDEHPHVERVSRQPVHAEEIEEPVDKMQQISDDIESFVDAVKEAGTERLQEAIHTVQEEIADVNETILEAVPHHDDQTTVPEPDTTEKMQSHESQILEQTEESTSENDVPEQGHDQDATHHEQQDMNRQIIDEIAAFEDLPKDVHSEAGENGSNDGNQITSATEDIKDEEPVHVEAQAPIPIPVPSVEPATEAIPITENAPELVTESAKHYEPPTELPSTETAESTPEYLDQPTAASEDTVVETTFKPAEEVQFHEEIVVEAPAPTEEEHREQIPVATSEEPHYATEEGNTEGTEVVFEETYEQDHKEPVGTEAILEQQAAPVSETGHDNMATAHDEL